MSLQRKVRYNAPLWHRAKHGTLYHLRPWKRTARGAAEALASVSACGICPWTGWADFDWFQPAPPADKRLCKKCLAIGL